MPEPNHQRDRPVRRLAEAMVSPNSYGSVLILILLTYVLSVSMTQTWGRSLVLLVQIGTVWLALHVSSARRGVRAFATRAPRDRADSSRRRTSSGARATCPRRPSS